MQGDVVKAARWLGGSMVLSGAIFAVGLARVRPAKVDRPDGPAVEARPTPSRPARVEALLDRTEKLRQAGDEWERFWFLDKPSALTPFRTNGGLGP